MLCLLVSFAFSFGAACCFRFIPVFWVHVFACIRFEFFPLGPRAVFTLVFVFACIWLVYFSLGTSVGFHFIWRDLVFLLFAVVTFLHVKFLAVLFGLMCLFMVGLLCEPRDICVNPNEKSLGCCVRPGISV